MVSCFGLLRRMVAKKLGIAAPLEPASGQGTEFEELSATDMMESVIGIPKGPRHHHKAVGKARLRRVHDFFSMSAAKILTLVWLVVCSVVMRVHYRLFKHGTWFTHREGIRCNAFEFAGHTPRSPAVAALSALAAMLLDPRCGVSPYLKTLHLRFGEDVAHWPPRLVSALEVSLVLAFATFWRNIYRYFDCYPWRLAPALEAHLARADWAAVNFLMRRNVA